MQASINVVETLRANDYYLMTNEDGNEVYDDGGNLLLYQTESGNCMSVPNTAEVRKLYDLPVDTPLKKETIRREDVIKPGNLLRIPNDSNRTVWVGQKNEHSVRATKMLIDLFYSPKYQTMMKNPNTVKLKVWEKIANDLEAKGFKIATNPRDAGLRTFQKWRNMERTYWKFLKIHCSDESIEDKQKKKPYFFDDLHVFMSKHTKEAMGGLCSADGNEVENIKDVDDEDEEVYVDNRVERKPLKRKRISDLYGTDCEAFPRQALTLLTSLVTSPKYDVCLTDPSSKLHPNKTKIWESIYMDMVKEGWNFGNSVREGALIISQKWCMVEKTILKKKLCGPRTTYSPTLRKAVLMEIEKRKTLGSDYPDDPSSPSEISHPNNKRLKGGDFQQGVIEALLKVIGSGLYQNLLATSDKKRTKVWENVFDIIQSQGFQIAGETKREKVTKLFQKWRNMKKTFVKYQIAKFKGKDVKKPMFYEPMFKIISQDILSMQNSDCDSDEEMKMDDWDDDSESEDPADCFEIGQMDHDYGEPNGSNEAILSGSSQLPSNMDVDLEQRNTTSEAVINHSRSSRSYQVLKQIKSLHETSLAMQQQNFTKIISLLENQISQQNRLTTVISEYIMSQKLKSNPKNSHKNGNSSNSFNNGIFHS